MGKVLYATRRKSTGIMDLIRDFLVPWCLRYNSRRMDVLNAAQHRGSRSEMHTEIHRVYSLKAIFSLVRILRVYSSVELRVLCGEIIFSEAEFVDPATTSGRFGMKSQEFIIAQASGTDYDTSWLNKQP